MGDLRLQGIVRETETGFRLCVEDLLVQEGEFFALLGPSGCGKTTLLRLVAGLLAPDQGRVMFDGKDMKDIPAEKRGFAMVFQQPLLFPHMSIVDNAAFALKIQGVPRGERRLQALQMLERLSLKGYADRRPAELSGGQQQRVALARAILSRPRLLLMDEPFSALDPELREEMRELVMRLHREFGMTMLFVTHDREEAFQLADRMAVMREGRILQQGPPRELYEKPESPELALFLGAKNVIAGRLEKGWFTADEGSWRLELANVGSVGGGDMPVSGWLVLRPETLEVSLPGLGSGPGLESEEERGSFMRVLRGRLHHSAFRQGFLYMQVAVESEEKGSGSGLVIETVQKAQPGYIPTDGEEIVLCFDVRQACFILHKK